MITEKQRPPPHATSSPLSPWSRIFQRGRVTCVVHARTRTRRSVLSHGLTVFCHAHHAGPPPVQPHHRVCISSGLAGVPRPLRVSTRPPMYAWRWRRRLLALSQRRDEGSVAGPFVILSLNIRVLLWTSLFLPSAHRPPTFHPETTTALLSSLSSRPHTRPSRCLHLVTASSRCPRLMPSLLQIIFI